MKPSMGDSNNKLFSIKHILIIQLVVAIYTISSAFGKFASGYEFMSFGFIGFYCLEILMLGIYAILWQQIIKRFDLSIAYANRALALIWSMLWAVIFFNENITIQNIIGVVIVIIGTMIVNGEANDK